MTGPLPRGQWTAHIKPESWGLLHPRHTYRVTQSFRDYDGFEHAVGEHWTFLGFNFLPHDDGLSLFVSLDGEQEWHIRMQLQPEEQGAIVNALAEYVAEIPSKAGVIPPPPPRAAVQPQQPKAPRILAAVACFFGAVLLHTAGDGPRLVAPTESSIVNGLAGLALIVGGILLGLVGIIRTYVLSGRRPEQKRPPSAP